MAVPRPSTSIGAGSSRWCCCGVWVCGSCGTAAAGIGSCPTIPATFVSDGTFLPPFPPLPSSPSSPDESCGGGLLAFVLPPLRVALPSMSESDESSSSPSSWTHDTALLCPPLLRLFNPPAATCPAPATPSATVVAVAAATAAK